MKLENFLISVVILYYKTGIDMEFNLVTLRAIIGEDSFSSLLTDNEKMRHLCNNAEYTDWFDIDTKLANSYNIQNMYRYAKVKHCEHPLLKINKNVFLKQESFDIEENDDGTYNYTGYDDATFLRYLDDSIVLKKISTTIDITDTGLYDIPKIYKGTIISGGFNCSYNYLTSLENSPETVTGIYDCSYNSLKSLHGAPQIINRDFICTMNKGLSLEGGPKVVLGTFECPDCGITSLIGAPQIINKHFVCRNNKLTSLEGMPKEVGGNVYLKWNTATFKEEDVRAVCDVKGEVFC